MSSIETVFEPLIQHHVSLPARIEISSQTIAPLGQYSMTAPLRTMQSFRQSRIAIHPQLQIRLRDFRFAVLELVRHRECDRVRAPFGNTQMNWTIARGSGNLPVRRGKHIARQTFETNVIALVERHEADKIARPRIPSRGTEAIVGQYMAHVLQVTSLSNRL
jgi:hypothetical protein